MNDLINLSAFENARPDGAFAALNPAEESLSDGIGSSFGVIHYKGKTWTLKKSGEDYTFKRDDGSDAAFLDVVILRSPSFLSKSYYKEGYKEGVSTGKRPDCASVRGDRPDADVPLRQADACGMCHWNEFKSAANGGKGKACQDYRRLAVLIMPQQSKALLGEALMEPVALRIPPASLTDLAKLGEAMEQRGFHYSSYVTRIGFQSGVAHPKMTFQAIQKLTAAEAPVVLPMREDPLSYRITGEKDIGETKSLASGGAKRHIEHAPAQKNTADQQRVPVGGNGGQGQTDNVITLRPNTVETSSEQREEREDDEVAKLRRMLAEAEAKLAGGTTVVEAAPSDRGPASSAASKTPAADMAAEDSDSSLDDLVSQLLPK